MKKVILILLAAALAPCAVHASNSPESTTATALSGSLVDTTKNAPFAVGDDGLDHRQHSDNGGNQHILPPVMGPGSGDVSAAWSTTAAVYGTFTAGINAPYIFCVNPRYGTGSGVAVRTLTFTAAPSDTITIANFVPNSPTGGVCYGPYAPGMYVAVVGYGGTVSGTVGVSSLVSK